MSASATQGGHNYPLASHYGLINQVTPKKRDAAASMPAVQMPPLHINAHAIL